MAFYACSNAIMMLFRSADGRIQFNVLLLLCRIGAVNDRLLCFVLRQRRHGAPPADAAAAVAACDGMGGAGFSTLRVGGGGLCLCTFI